MLNQVVDTKLTSGNVRDNLSTTASSLPNRRHPVRKTEEKKFV
jgi:hypothetical protein